MTPTLQFAESFEGLTGHPPFPWQCRLFEAHFQCGALPAAVDIPTGLGKTAIMAIWLLARAAGAPLPRRLVYVVDRRAVVDQATEFAERLRKALAEDEWLAPLRRALGLGTRPLPISTLRGRHADNREWMADPAAPAIIVGTVDMVGSRLLFEGYGLSRRMRPFAAGLLGCDTLLMLDEAHLARPFERLLRAVETGRRPSSADAADDGAGRLAGPAACPRFPPPFRLLPLSATLDPKAGETPFRLDGEDRADPTVLTRLDAPKDLTVEAIPSGSGLDKALAGRAWDLMQDALATGGEPPAVAIYCDRRGDAEKVAAELRKRAGKAPQPQPFVILFVGGRRVRERQEAADELRKHGLTGDADTARDAPVFLVATSAGEVGVDLDADHMVCDLVAWERMVQRLGRVNRRGKRAARVLVIDPTPPDDKDRKKLDPRVIARREAVRALFDALPGDENGGRQAGPGAVMALAADPVQRAQIADATTPMPLYPALTRPLVEAWAMTSLEDHAGRPEIAPWLRGWVEEDQPQTVLLWRRYLPLRLPAGGGEAEPAPERELRAFFAAAPPQTAELLETETSRVVDWLKERASKCLTETEKAASPAVSDTRADEETPEDGSSLAPLTTESPVAFLLDGANRPVAFLSLVEIGNKNKKNKKDLQDALTGRRLVLDARIGGLADGLLDPGADKAPLTIDNDGWTETHGGQAATPWNLTVTVRPASGAEAEESDTVPAPDDWQDVLELPYAVSMEGEARSLLVVRKQRSMGESQDAPAVARKAQRLDEHQSWAGAEAERIAAALDLDPKDTAMLLAAARHHDDGKAAKRWQRAFGAMPGDDPYAKTVKAPNQHILNGFRHEFKSALDAEKNGLDGLDHARFDLALHLIAAHHGHARPAIGVKGHDDLPPSAAEAAAHGIAIRFARLQREWGPWGLAWWEALLRAADQAASRRLDEGAD